MRLFSAIFALSFLFTGAIAQPKTPESFGFRHLTTTFNGDPVDILIKSRNGDEQQPKPLFFYVQGSLPQPLIKYDEKGMYGVFTFPTDSLAKTYHLVIVSKPYIPVVADVKTLGRNYTWRDAKGLVPTTYNERNNLDYYVNRNLHIIRFLQKQPWVSRKALVLAGHSEGSTICAKMASVSPAVTHLIYSGGNPLGRINSIIQQSRRHETDSTSHLTNEQFSYWEQVVLHPETVHPEGDSHKATFSFSIPPLGYLLSLSVPVLVTFGTKDDSAPFNDYLHTEVIRRKRRNFTFRSYPGTEHNFFPVRPDGSIDYSVYNWDKVGDDWYKWLREHPGR
ncbi:alpha/beta hydrolase family protein [Arsenicibacter rosenii]|uniref:Dienelactone hydrolase domain-containing protein n=1 Tax=Arsenicibacter rosenii TaxID=1750698 RepID=A0A1S2VKG8_9BACT|nr:dienelactone hydrolase family protein [Arsenicibacter rosenii]OIN59249.1 hypothetical protein BLX24_09675 [Arsenicibacter rosenii]